MRTTILLAALLLVSILPSRPADAQPLPKAQVGERIKRVEDGVDEFRNYLERRGNDARDKSSTSGKTRSSAGKNDARKNQAENTTDELDNALGDLNKSTNRLRRKFDATDTWMETKGQVQEIVDDGRKINQYVAKGTYGSEVARIWGSLRSQINELARVYGVAPLSR